ncbi:MAG: hypothetical protein U1F20_01200 [Lysobacterales bacterium]
MAAVPVRATRRRPARSCVVLGAQRANADSTVSAWSRFAVAAIKEVADAVELFFRPIDSVHALVEHGQMGDGLGVGESLHVRGQDRFGLLRPADMGQRDGQVAAHVGVERRPMSSGWYQSCRHPDIAALELVVEP